MKHSVLMAAMAATLLFPATAKAQYPQITQEAKKLIDSLENKWQAHSDSAWAVASPSW